MAHVRTIHTNTHICCPHTYLQLVQVDLHQLELVLELPGQCSEHTYTDTPNTYIY